MSEALAGTGTIFQRYNLSTLEWDNIAEVNSITGPGIARDAVDVTSFDTEGGYREFIVGLRDGGTVVLEMNFTRETYNIVLEDFANDAPQNYAVVFLDEDDTIIEFAGLITELPMNILMDDKITTDVTIEVTQDVTIRDSWSSYWITRYISQLTAQATSATAYTVTATIVGTGQDGMSVEYSSDLGVTWTVTGTTATDTYNATGMTSGVLYQWRARLYKGIHYGNYVDAINYLQAGVNEPCLKDQPLRIREGAHDTSLEFYDGLADKPFWVSFWVNLSGSTIMADKTYNFMCSMAGGEIWFRIFNGGAGSVYIGRRTTSAIGTGMYNAWHHLLFYYDGSAANAGCKIYVDKVQKDTIDLSSGSYTKMAYYQNTLDMAALGLMCDVKIGQSTLTTQQITDLYDHKINGNEVLHFPCTEGYGIVAHNVANKNIGSNAYMPELASDRWSQTQAIFLYNYNYGCTKINNYFFPNYSDKTKFFKPIECYGIFGHSNANGGGDYLDFGGTYYDELLDTNLMLNGVFANSGAIHQNIFRWYFTNYWQNVGSHCIIGFRHYKNAVEMMMFRRGEGGASLVYEAMTTANFDPAHKPNNLSTFETYLTDQITEIFYHGREPWVKAFVMVLGEVDGGDVAWANNYKTKMDAIFAELDALTGWTPRKEILQCQLPSALPGHVIVRAAQAQYVSENLEADEILDDGWTYETSTHMDTASWIRIGEEIETNLASEIFANSKSYLNILLPGYGKLYYTAHP